MGRQDFAVESVPTTLSLRRATTPKSRRSPRANPASEFSDSLSDTEEAQKPTTKNISFSNTICPTRPERKARGRATPFPSPGNTSPHGQLRRSNRLRAKSDSDDIAVNLNPEANIEVVLSLRGSGNIRNALSAERAKEETGTTISIPPEPSINTTITNLDEKVARLYEDCKQLLGKQRDSDHDIYVVHRPIPNRALYYSFISPQDYLFRLNGRIIVTKTGEITSESIYKAYEKTGSELARVLIGLFDRAYNIIEAKKLDQLVHSASSCKYQHPYHGWLAMLCRWKSTVGDHALGLFTTVLDVAGSNSIGEAYVHTKRASIYVWWRVCKIIADVEAITVPGNKMVGIPEYFRSIVKLFYGMWMGLACALKRDLKSIKTCIASGESKKEEVPDLPLFYMVKHAKTRTITMSELRQQRGLFRVVPNLNVLPEVDPTHRNEVETKHFPENGEYLLDSHPHLQPSKQWLLNKLETFFKDTPDTYEDFEQLTKLPTSILEQPELHLKPKYPLSRAFKRWREQVKIALDSSHSPTINRETTDIYQSLLRNSKLFPAFYMPLRILLALTPDRPELMKAFKRLIPRKELEE